MKKQLEALIQAALTQAVAERALAITIPASIHIERTRNPEHGDYACNIAMILAKEARLKPREIATLIVARLPVSGAVRKADIAGPGFINMFIGHQAYYDVLAQVHASGEAFGRSSIGAGRSVMVEFVSANPTGPLHVGHGRGAAYGATVADLLAAVGFRVHREYYINDAGRQMDILGTSVWLRYLELCGESFAFPSNGYQGDYVFDIAADVHRAHGDKFRHGAVAVFNDIPADAPQGGDKEDHIDALIARAKQLLGADDYETVFSAGLDVILDDIRRDLQEFGVVYDHWYSERGLVRSGAVDQAVARLQASGHTYEKDGALWFRSTDYGDEKDRVLVRENGVKTYFASDVAYHADKLERGFERVIDIWGADHHGYVPRVKAAMEAIGDDPSCLDVLLVQFAILYKGGERMQMSTRSGEFVTLRELRDEVGNDAARLFYVMRRCEQHMDFDLDLAVSRSADNPVYYIQYAHARICSVHRQLAERGLGFEPQVGLAHLSLLAEKHEYDLMVSLSKYPEVLETSALAHEPHQLAHYLRDLANDFHTYYNAHQFIVDDATLRNARLSLIFAVRQVVRNGLGLLGVSAPEEM